MQTIGCWRLLGSLMSNGEEQITNQLVSPDNKYLGRWLTLNVGVKAEPDTGATVTLSSRGA